MGGVPEPRPFAPSLPCWPQVWRKVLPLGLIFFVASFNLTILQAGPPLRAVPLPGHSARALQAPNFGSPVHPAARSYAT